MVSPHQEQTVLRSVCTHGDSAHYLFHDGTKDVDLGRYSLQCGRRNDSLKLWIAWREIQDSTKMVEKYCDLSGYLEDLVNDSEHLSMMSERD